MDPLHIIRSVSLPSRPWRPNPLPGERLSPWLAVPFAVFLVVYAPAVGHGFISDDFRWIVESRVSRPAEVYGLFSRNTGFYRPAVALTFAADYALFLNRPLGYGLTNLALAIGCAALLAALMRSMEMPIGAALFGAGLWLLNFHGIAMALLWISGRTALVLVAASLASAIAVVRGRLMAAAVCLLIALFAKEEAVALPFMLACWLVILGRAHPGRVGIRPVVWLLVSFVLLAAYLLLRDHAGAFTPISAPPYYRFTFAPAVLTSHILQYADRSLTWPAVVCIVGFLLLRPRRPIDISFDTVLCGAAWLAGGYALTMFLPMPSSLYACFPSLGACIIAAEIGRALWSASEPRAQLRTVVAGALVAIALIPVYRARNQRWTALADFSTSVLDQLEIFTAGLPDGAPVVLLDDRAARVNLESAFGTLLNDAYLLETGRKLTLWVEPPLGNAALAGLRPPCPTCVAMRLQVSGGNVSKLP